MKGYRNSLLVVFSSTIFLWTIISFFRIITTYAPDFSVYYQAAKNIAAGISVYTGQNTFTGFAYPLVSGLFYLPFLLFSYALAQGIFILLSVVSCVGCVWVCIKILYKKVSFRLFLLSLALVFLSFPTKFTLGMGQINLIAYFFLLFSLYCYLTRSFPVVQNQQRLYTTLIIAFLFAVACVLKPVLGFMLLFFLLEKKWKIIGYFFLFLFTVVLLGMLIDHHSLQDYFYYVRHVIPEMSKPVGKEIYYNQGLMSFVFREIPNHMWQVLLSYIGMAAVVIAGIYTAFRSKSSVYRFALLLCMIPILDTLSWQHHFVFLIFPFFYCIFIFFHAKKWKSLVTVCVAYVLVSWNFPHPEVFSSFPKNILLSNTFYGGLLLFFLCISAGACLIHPKGGN